MCHWIDSLTHHCSCNSSWHIEHACTFDWVAETGGKPCGGSWWLAKNGKYCSDGRAEFWRTRIGNKWNLPMLPQTKHVTSWSGLCSFELCKVCFGALTNCWGCVKSKVDPALNSTTSCILDVPKKSILNHSADEHNTVSLVVQCLFLFLSLFR